jgi:peptide-methionine (S)-S-oxide reductase
LQHGAALVKKVNHEGTASLLNGRECTHKIDNMLFQTAAKASSIESLKRLTQGYYSHGAVRRQTRPHSGGYTCCAAIVSIASCGMTAEKATFGAGCFWGVEETFRKLKGVISTTVGYAGGNKDNPTYEDVCRDETGHAEVVEVEFDPSQISYNQLLDVFWSNHNPTTLNRQGPDVGIQYRSVIFYHSPEQKAAAEKSKIEKAAKFPRPIVTQIEPAPKFWRAEEYHQRYLEKRGQSHCAI